MEATDTPIRILHVDDNELDRELIRIHLKRRDREISILEADSVQNALVWLRRERFDLVLCDYQMPGEDGLALLRHLNNYKVSVPFIFLTGQGNESIAAEALRLGADDYFAKDSGFAQYERLLNSIRRTVIAHRQEQDRLRSDQYFRATFEQAAVGMAHLNLDGRYTLVNRRLCDIVGLKENELLQTTWDAITHHDDIAPEHRLFARLRSGDVDKGAIQKRYLTPGGDVVWVNLTMSMAHVEAGESYIVAVMEDISDTKRIEQTLRLREEQYRELVEGTRDLVLMVDLKGTFLFTNHASREFFGLDPEELIGRSAWDFVHPLDLAGTQRSFSEWISSDRPVLSFDNRQVSIDGTVRRVSWNINGHFDAQGRLAGLNGIARDLTPLLAAREQVARLNRLRQVVSDINQALVRIRDRQELYDAVTQIFEEKGKFDYVWLGSVDHPGGQIHPAAWSGPCAGFLDLICAEGRSVLKYAGMIHHAVEMREAVFSGDIRTDGRVSDDWRAVAVGCGLISAATVPFFVEDAVVGAMSVFSPQSEYFVADEVELLLEIASDISYALSNIHRDEKLQETVETLEHERSFLQTMIDASPVHFFIKRADGQYLIVNRLMRELFGIGEGSVEGQPLAQLVTHVRTDMELLRKQDEEVLETGQTVVCSGVPLIDAQGREHFMHVVKSPVLDERGEVRYIVGTTTDITELKRIEQEATRQREQIEAQARRLAETNAEVESFAYQVSHDLRAPLRHITSYADLLREESADHLSEEGREYLGCIEAAAKRMSALVESLLRLSRSQAADVRREPIDLAEVAAAIIAALRAADPQRRVEVTTQEGLQTEGDRALLEIVLDNLLRNAWKFTTRCEAARIGIGYRDEGDKRVFFVQDNGIGFDESMRHRLFVPFSRLHDTDDFEGSGIGLAMVKRIVERHGGAVWAEGSPGGGATFFFTLEV